MPKLHPNITGREAAESSTDPIEALPPFVSKRRAGEALNMSQATVWRRIKDGSLQVDAGGRVIKASIRRFAQPRVKP
jgi:hypothetical protein